MVSIWLLNYWNWNMYYFCEVVKFILLVEWKKLFQTRKHDKKRIINYVIFINFSYLFDTANNMDNTKENRPTTTTNNNNSNNNNNNNNNNAVRCCAGCGGKIIDRFLLHAVDRFWHTGCLKCSCCSVQLGDIGHSCFSKAGMILCKKDYLRWVQENVSKYFRITPLFRRGYTFA